MNIKKRLVEEVQKARRDSEKAKAEDAHRETEAKELFLPIVRAMEQVQEELLHHDNIKICISDQHVDIKLGKGTALEAHRYGWSNSFTIEETNTYEYPEYDVIETKHDFGTAEEAIDFLVKKCAQYVARRQE